eukprot:364191-Chlamydomonas_euryale.AAC.11
MWPSPRSVEAVSRSTAVRAVDRAPAQCRAAGESLCVRTQRCGGAPRSGRDRCDCATWLQLSPESHTCPHICSMRASTPVFKSVEAETAVRTTRTIASLRACPRPALPPKCRARPQLTECLTVVDKSPSSGVCVREPTNLCRFYCILCCGPGLQDRAAAVCGRVLARTACARDPLSRLTWRRGAARPLATLLAASCALTRGPSGAFTAPPPPAARAFR